MLGSKKFFGLMGLLAIGLLACAASGAQAALILGDANLNGAQEVPPVATAAIGVSILNVDSNTGLFDLELFVSGITQAQLAGVGPNNTPVHIHNAPPGVNGPIVVDLGFLGTIDDIGTLGFKLAVEGAQFGGTQGGLNSDTATNIANLLAGNMYVNVHTTTAGGGEIRGQINAIPEPTSIGLGLIGVCGLAAACRRRKRRA